MPENLWQKATDKQRGARLARAPSEPNLTASPRMSKQEARERAFLNFFEKFKPSFEPQTSEPSAVTISHTNRTFNGGYRESVVMLHRLYDTVLPGIVEVMANPRLRKATFDTGDDSTAEVVKSRKDGIVVTLSPGQYLDLAASLGLDPWRVLPKSSFEARFEKAKAKFPQAKIPSLPTPEK